MRARRLPLAALLLPAVVFAQAVMPPSGQDVDAIHAIEQLDEMPAPCVAIATRNATLVLSLRRLTDIAAALPQSVVSADDAMKALRAGRAADLLARMNEPSGRDECRTLRSGLGSGDEFVLLDEIRQGKVFVRTNRPHERISLLNVHYLATRHRWGTIHVRLPGHETSELDISWWQS